MKKKIVVSILFVNVLLTMACSIALEGISELNPLDPHDHHDPISEMFAQETADALDAEEAGSAPAEAAAVPEYQPVTSSGSDVERVVAGSHEYSVNATNFECTCQATDNMTVDIQFKGSQVEITNGGGGATMVYDKIDDNKYQKSEMGYYILMSGEGDQATETKVEEENITTITFTNNGYVMENFKGTASSPCCYYTFTVEK